MDCKSPNRFSVSESRLEILDMMSDDHINGYGRHFVAENTIIYFNELEKSKYIHH